MLQGNLNGIKDVYISQLEELLGYKIPGDKLLDEFVVDRLISITEKINREIIIVMDSKKNIIAINIGDHKTAPFPDIEKYAKKRGLNGLISFHTHPNGVSNLSQADLSSLMELRFNLIGALAKNQRGNITSHIGLLELEGEEIISKTYGPLNLSQLNSIDIDEKNIIVDKFFREQSTVETAEEERAILVGVNLGKQSGILDINSSMEELKELTYTAGGSVVGTIIQNKEKIDNVFYIGRGKLEELQLMVQNKKANLVICNDELSAIQLKVLEKSLGVKVIDRTQLILDIFARHAKTSEGKLQVELAQLKYRLPRLIGMGHVLSRTGGGIGTRGPGEKKLETDRRAIYREINILENRIKSMKKVRGQQKSRRQKNKIPIVSLVGYTNAGKSTLFNVLTDSQVLSENKLFATLDSTTRKLKGNSELLLQDTVGFIDKLPHDLVKAFESTLEGVVDSDLLLHVVDSSNENFLKQIKLVDQVLKSLGADNKKIIYVFNKIDIKCEDFEIMSSTIREKKVNISAKYNKGIEKLETLIQEELRAGSITKEIKIPYEDIAIISTLHDYGLVIDKEYLADHIKVKVNYTEELSYLVDDYTDK